MYREGMFGYVTAKQDVLYGCVQCRQASFRKQWVADSDVSVRQVGKMTRERYAPPVSMPPILKNPFSSDSGQRLPASSAMSH